MIAFFFFQLKLYKRVISRNKLQGEDTPVMTNDTPSVCMLMVKSDVSLSLISPDLTWVFFYLLSKNDAVKKIGLYLSYFTLHHPPTAAPRESRLSSVIKSVISLAIIWLPRLELATSGFVPYHHLHLIWQAITAEYAIFLYFLIGKEFPRPKLNG